MKKLILIMMLFAPFLTVKCMAYGDGHTWMLCDGMKWTFRVNDSDGLGLGLATATVSGDKTVKISDGQFEYDVDCKIIRLEFSDTSMEANEYIVSEESPVLKLYQVNNSAPYVREIFSFGHKEGNQDVGLCNRTYRVNSCDYVDNYRQIGKRLKLESENGNTVCLIYGIGASSLEISTDSEQQTLKLDFVNLECPDGNVYDEHIFTENSFNPDNAFLADEKKWEYQRIYPEFFEIEPTHSYEKVSGDALAGGLHCKSIDINGDMTVYRCSKDLRVFEYEEVSDRWLLKFDFSLQENTTYPEYPFLNITKSDIISVDGIDRRRIRFGTGKDAEYMVEGIGSSSRGSLYDTPEPPDGGHNIMTACYENGRLIFKYENFEKGGSTNLKLINADNTSLAGPKAAVYDTNGHLIDNPVPGEIYIKDGKKYISRQ